MKLTEEHVGKWVGRDGGSPVKVLFAGQEYAVVESPLGEEICTRNISDWICGPARKKMKKGQKVLMAQSVVKDKDKDKAAEFFIPDQLFLCERDAAEYAKEWCSDLVKFPAGPWIEVDL